MEKIAICRFYLLNKLILNILKISLVVYTGIENKDKKEIKHPPGKGEEFLLNTKKNLFAVICRKLASGFPSGPSKKGNASC